MGYSLGPGADSDCDIIRISISNVIGTDHVYTVYKDDTPFLEVMAPRYDWNPFSTARIFQNHLYIGLGDSVYFASMRTREVRRAGVSLYLGYFYKYRNRLYVTFEEQLYCLDNTCKLVWISDSIVVDGITIRQITDDGTEVSREMDPLGGWAWCALSLGDRKEYEWNLEKVFMKANLTIVEGLPGSGKSMTARMIADELEKEGRQVVCMDEGVKEYPASYTGCNFPDFGTERATILEKWRLSMKDASGDITYVFSCIFLQNPMYETMMRFGMEEATSETYVAEIAGIIRPAPPVVIYIGRSNVKAATDSVLDERGNDWLKAVTDYHVSQGHGKQNHLSDYDGYIKCLEERRNRELDILRSLDIDDYTISQDITTDEFATLSTSASWNCPTGGQVELVIENSTKSFAVRHKGMSVATINWFDDYGMYWFMREFIVHKDYQGQMIGTLLHRFSENFTESIMEAGWKVCINLKSPKKKESFCHELGFQTITEDEDGSGMEKALG